MTVSPRLSDIFVRFRSNQADALTDIDTIRDLCLVVKTRPGPTNVSETTRVLDENISRKTEEYTDRVTGKVSFRTVEIIEKTLEHEVQVSLFTDA